MMLLSLFQIVWILLWILVIGICGFALWRGGTPERIGAALVLLVALAGAAVNLVPDGPVRQVGHLAADGVLAAGFLAVAVRFASLWLGAAMLFQAVQFSLHAYYFVLQRPHDSLYSTVNNVNLLGVLTCLLVGTLAARRRASGRAATRDGA